MALHKRRPFILIFFNNIKLGRKVSVRNVERKFLFPRFEKTLRSFVIFVEEKNQAEIEIFIININHRMAVAIYMYTDTPFSRDLFMPRYC